MAAPDRNSGTASQRCWINAPYCSGTAQPTVSGKFTVVAPAATTAWLTSTKNSGSVREASSGENSTSSTKVFARLTPSTASRKISSCALPSLNSR